MRLRYRKGEKEEEREKEVEEMDITFLHSSLVSYFYDLTKEAALRADSDRESWTVGERVGFKNIEV